MNVALTGVTAKGYRCARVARPDGAFVPQHVAILMARPRQSGVVPKTSGVTMAESSLIGRQAYGLVAVMERLEQRGVS